MAIERRSQVMGHFFWVSLDNFSFSVSATATTITTTNDLNKQKATEQKTQRRRQQTSHKGTMTASATGHQRQVPASTTTSTATMTRSTFFPAWVPSWRYACMALVIAERSLLYFYQMEFSYFIFFPCLSSPWLWPNWILCYKTNEMSWQLQYRERTS